MSRQNATVAHLLTIIVVYIFQAPSRCDAQELEHAWESLVAKNEEAVGRIFAAQFEVQGQYEIFNNKPSSELFLKLVHAFDHRKGIERQRLWVLSQPQQNQEGDPINCFDVLITEDDCRVLENWDWDRSDPILIPAHQKSIRARMGRREVVARGWFNEIGPMMLFELRQSNISPSLPVRQFIATGDNVRVNGRTILLSHPTPKDVGFGNTDFEIRFSENGLIEFFGFAFSSQHGKLKGFQRVDEFCEPTAGIYFPAKLSGDLRRPSDGTVSSHTILRVSGLIVNDSVKKKAFEFRFPENAMVVDMNLREGQTEYDLYLWGPDNRPKLKLNSVRDLPGEVFVASFWSRYAAYGWAIILLIPGLGIAYYLRRRRKNV